MNFSHSIDKNMSANFVLFKTKHNKI